MKNNSKNFRTFIISKIILKVLLHFLHVYKAAHLGGKTLTEPKTTNVNAAP